MPLRINIYFFFVTKQLTPGPGRLVVEFSRSHTFIFTPLYEWSARRRGRYLHNTQQTQETNIHALSESRTHDPGKQAALDRTATGFDCLLTWHIYLVCRLIPYPNPNEVMKVVNFGLCVVTLCVYPTLSLRCFTTPKIVWILTTAVNLSCLR
jgi:hypothetical protein